jgi:two-component system chemotaxis response regulator CheY
VNSLKILIVDDEEMAAKIMRLYLKDCGACEVVHNGLDAVERVEQKLKSDGQSYDLICLDIRMPGMDGQETLQRIRALEAEHGLDVSDSARVIMTTLLDDAQNMTQAFMNKCEIYLVKPIKKAELLEQMENLGLM